MPAPSTVPTWATDANFTSGPKAGSPTKVTPSAGAQAQGLVPDEPFKGEHSNWALHYLCGWAGWLSTINTQVDFLNRTFSWLAQHTFSVSPITPGPTKYPGTGVVFEEYLNLASAKHAASDWAYSPTNGFLLSSGAGGGEVHIPISLPSDQELLNLRVRMRVGGGTATLALLRFTANEAGFGAPTRTVLGSVTRTSTTGAEVTLAADISHTVLRTRSTGSGWYVLSVISGSSTDEIYSVCLKHRRAYTHGGGVST